MKKIKFFVLLIISLPVIIVLINILDKDVWDENARLLKQEIVAIDESVETVDLKNITPFEWDVVYSFDPYTPKEEIYEQVGYKWDSISETVNEGMNQIVFMKDGKVVCYVYGYPSNNGFGISFKPSSLHEDNNLQFRVSSNEGVTYLVRSGEPS
ncbi:hypothetical protein SAMN05216389_12249 [Oceanobacillus limi]|uniref:Uncharacterized protein n=1 Tax=Oceanobacillus limi TaxID=930131 RepID=A0A1I0GM85_9BACI|nr:hypothetical protein [Oceanobacillus limi]SET71479.1 hypothetical protein SAMN05216389_12249 [Oceanobacillus limi]